MVNGRVNAMVNDKVNYPLSGSEGWSAHRLLSQ